MYSPGELIKINQSFIKEPKQTNFNIGFHQKILHQIYLTRLIFFTRKIILLLCQKKEIKWLYDNYGQRVSEIGFSGHHLGIGLDVAAYTLGARWIERHFTKDRTWKGTDHAASLEYNGLKKLSRDLNNCFHALHYKEDEILPIERFQRDKLKNRK